MPERLTPARAAQMAADKRPAIISLAMLTLTAVTEIKVVEGRMRERRRARPREIPLQRVLQPETLLQIGQLQLRPRSLQLGHSNNPNRAGHLAAQATRARIVRRAIADERAWERHNIAAETSQLLRRM